MSSVEPELARFLSVLRLGIVQGVSLEIDNFKPEGWTWAVEGDSFHVQGPWTRRWLLDVKKMAYALAYSHGSVLRRVSSKQLELYTWIDEEGEGFKVVFSAHGAEDEGPGN